LLELDRQDKGIANLDLALVHVHPQAYRFPLLGRRRQNPNPQQCRESPGRQKP
jgi:hypothetical protein